MAYISIAKGGRPRKHDLMGRRFGRLAVVAPAPPMKKHGGWWECKCDCGNTTMVPGCTLLRGKTESCGCLRKLTVRFAARTHGLSKTAVHHVWESMKRRCNNPNDRAYKHYGGRGIKVCERWNDFSLFVADMGERPTGHWIERRDNDGPYSPSNCYWATTHQQSRNRRNNLFLSIGDETQTLSDWSKALGVNYNTLRHRWRQGWSVDEIIHGRNK